VVVCTYDTDNGPINIEVNKMLERLNIEPVTSFWGTDYNIKEVVNWNVSKTYRVKYQPASKLIYDIPKVLPIGTFNSYSSALSLSNYLNDLHDRAFMDMPDDIAEFYLRKYGNDYTKQIKGEK